MLKLAERMLRMILSDINRFFFILPHQKVHWLLLYHYSPVVKDFGSLFSVTLTSVIRAMQNVSLNNLILIWKRTKTQTQKKIVKKTTQNLTVPKWHHFEILFSNSSLWIIPMIQRKSQVIFYLLLLKAWSGKEKRERERKRKRENKGRNREKERERESLWIDGIWVDTYQKTSVSCLEYLKNNVSILD